jgi:predicted porin
MVNFLPFLTGIAYEPAITAGGVAYREDNVVQYTKEFGSTHLVAHYTFGTGMGYQGAQASTVPGGEVPGNPRANAGYGLGAYYLSGPFGIGTGYDQTNPAQTATSPVGEARLAFIGASYEVGPVRFMGGYRWRNSTFSNGVTAIRDNFYWAGVKYAATPAVNVIAGYYYDQVKGASLVQTGTATSLPGFSQVALMGTYSLSKRTTLYAASAYAHNGPLNYDTLLQTGTSYGYGNATTLTGLAPGQKGQVGVTAGLRVTF